MGIPALVPIEERPSWLDIARIDGGPEASVAPGAEEGDFSGKPGTQEFKIVLTVRAESGSGLAVLALAP